MSKLSHRIVDYGGLFNIFYNHLHRRCFPFLYCFIHQLTPYRSVFCPKGTNAPINVDQGYYSLPSILGYFTGNGDEPEEKQLNQHSQIICPKGHFCLEGIRYRCKAGRWGGSLGLYTPECDGLCSPGYYCPGKNYSVNSIS